MPDSVESAGKRGTLLKFSLRKPITWVAAVCVLVTFGATGGAARAWDEAAFEHRPLYGFPLPRGRDTVIGNPISYQIRKRDTLLDVGRWFGVTAKEISDANGHLDWWVPPAGKVIILPTEHILPAAAHLGIVLNIPEMRLYYYPPPPYPSHGGKRAVRSAAYKDKHVGAQVVYTFPVGLGRFDWRTPVGAFKVRAKTRDPTWVLPDDIYQEHLERDGEAEHSIPGGDPDNPLGRYRLSLTLPLYAIHGTNVPWGVGMEVSHGCVRLYPEDIERLFNMVKVGAPGRFVYEPIKFGWRGDALYVEVHEDLYGRYPGLWKHALQEVERRGLQDYVDIRKLEQAVEQKTGLPTYVMPGSVPGASPDGSAAGSPLASDPAS